MCLCVRRCVREKVGVITPLPPIPCRLRPETLIMLQKCDRLEHPSALQVPHRHIQGNGIKVKTSVRLTVNISEETNVTN